MACARLAAALVAAFAVAAPCGSALAARAPQSLHAFTLRADEPVVHTFARTPSFAWSPVPGTKTYQFELSTSKTFSDSGIVWTTDTLDAFIADSQQFLPANRMPYAGMPNAADRADLVAYLQQVAK